MEYFRPLFSLLIVSIIIVIFIHTGCDRTPTGPNIPEQRKLAIFCVLNPSLKSQPLQIARTVTFHEAESHASINLDVPNAQISFSGPDSEFEVLPMPPGEVKIDKQENRLGTDFLWGSTNFNYLINGPKVKPTERYKLAIHSNGYGSSTADTKVPGPFQITEINIEPELTKEELDYTSLYFNQNPPNLFKVTWSESQGAAGYLVDITLVEYDIPEWFQHSEFELINLPNSGFEWRWLGIEWPDSSQFISTQYREIPLNLALKSENRYQRGILTQDKKIEIPIKSLFAMTEFPQNWDYRKKHVKRIRVYVHALDQAFYNFASFQFSQIENENIIGREIQIPDIGNVGEGVGVFGSVYTRVATSRLIHRILENYDSYNVEEEGNPGAFFNKDECYAGYSYFPLSQVTEPTPTELLPESGSLLKYEENVELSWQKTDNATNYLLVLKPHYMWFWPGNISHILGNNSFMISWNDFPYRDCELEWYVMTLRSITSDTAIVLSVSGYKAPLAISNVQCSQWSDSHYLIIASGDLPGFEDKIPKAIAPIDGSTLASTCILQWNSVPGTDVYLVFIRSDLGDYATAVSRDTLISPPFPDECDFVDGLCGLSEFRQSVTYTWQVCALRVKSGALGFTLDEPKGTEPPKVYPRYQHPSGIMLQSQWSEPRRFTVR